MLAMHPGLAVRYDFAWTALSILVAAGFAFAGFGMQWARADPQRKHSGDESELGEQIVKFHGRNPLDGLLPGLGGREGMKKSKEWGFAEI